MIVLLIIKILTVWLICSDIVWTRVLDRNLVTIESRILVILGPITLFILIINFLLE